MPKRVDHRERRAQIATAAARCIASQGLEGATVRSIAGASCFSKGVVEHYFRDKEELLAAALEQMNARYLQRERELTTGLTGLAALRARLGCILPLTEEAREEWKIRLCFWSVAATRPEAGGAQRKRLALTRERYRQDLLEAEAAGELAAALPSERIAGELTLFMAGASCGALLDPAFYSPAYLRQVIEGTLSQLTREFTP